ncbi:MAG: hypothetical protein LBN31_15310 [Hungatella sp.]|nr:hypothetical protein [Hungatella sp.]
MNAGTSVTIGAKPYTIGLSTEKEWLLDSIGYTAGHTVLLVLAFFVFALFLIFAFRAIDFPLKAAVFFSLTICRNCLKKKISLFCNSPSANHLPKATGWW